MSVSLDTLAEPARAALAAEVARLKHDLGKYVALQQRWLAPEASAEERRAALRQDLLETRRSPSGIRDAWSVWEEFRSTLWGEAELPGGHRVDLSGDSDLARVGDAMGVVAEVIAQLRGERATDAAIARGAEAALAVSEGCRALDRRVRAACQGGTPGGR